MNKKFRKALEYFYWQAHSDGGLAEFDNSIREHLSSPKWKMRREQLIDEVLQKLGLPNNACTRLGVGSGKKAKSTSKKKSVKSVGQRPTPSG